MTQPARERLIAAALELFEEQGYDATTVDQIASRAGTGRTTFFRTFGSKEEVALPDHELLLPRLEARLETATVTTWRTALREAASLVLEHYLQEGETARARYRLISTVPALRDRETISSQRYLRLFTQHVQEPADALQAELIAAAVITAHNHVLGNWLRGLEDDPRGAFEAAMDRVLLPPVREPSGGTVVVMSSATDVESVLAEVRQAWSDRLTPVSPTPAPTAGRPNVPRPSLSLDPIAEARRQWAAHGWEGSADGMAAITSLMRAQQIALSRVESALREHGVTFARYEVLMLLYFSRAGSLPLAKIGERLQVHPTSVTNAVDRLETAGLVRRLSHPTDRRATLAEITDSGRTLALEATEDLNAGVFADPGLSSAGLAAVFEYLGEMRRNAGDF